MSCPRSGTEAPSHVTTVVRAPAYCNSFALCYELPIPWNEILTIHEKILLGKFTCCAGLELQLHRHACLAEPQLWRLHCHCDDQHSLQCLCSREVIRKVALDFIKGARMNRLHMWFREFVNSGRPDDINYVGSVVYNARHYLYFRLCFPFDAQAACIDVIRTCLSPEMGFFLKGTYNFWLVLFCDRCAADRLQSLRKCAAKVRGTIRRLLETIESLDVMDFLHVTTRAEDRRRHALRQSLLYGKCRLIRSLSCINLSAFIPS
ncbi:E4 ORF 34K [Bat mastadenovirus G]|uniref:E4 ORF 34K n=1 Tax=Bat mastadenovirus G TaxID=2015376 RepID=A0A1J0FAS0_9ADEN|nr:E4 ORF 34K [Bat mastadenovirus G]APC26079.1 E4 ORF 34K [Bat mastadenovirus G]